MPTGGVRKVFRHFVDVWPSWMCVFCMADEMNLSLLGLAVLHFSGQAQHVRYVLH